MLTPRSDRPAEQAPTRADRQMLRELSLAAQGADDAKLRKIVDVIEATGQHAFQSILDPLRPRLAALKAPRPLRFSRLMFLPLDGLIVPAPAWKRDQATIPRSVLMPMAAMVKAALPAQSEAVERVIEGHAMDNAAIIDRAGEMLWPHAADALMRAPAQAAIQETGLRPALFADITAAIVTALRCAVPLRALQREVAVGLLAPEESLIERIVAAIDGGSEEGAAMVVKLILTALPRAASTLRRLSTSALPHTAAMHLRAALNRGMEHILTEMENGAGLGDIVRTGSLSEVGAGLGNVVRLLQTLDEDGGSTRSRGRVAGIRASLDTACSKRFADGLQEGLIAPLAAADAAPVSAAGQAELERCARDLRSVEIVGRQLGHAAKYDALVSQASTSVGAAAERGDLATARAARLVEILAGPDAAEAIYRKASAAAARRL